MQNDKTPVNCVHRTGWRTNHSPLLELRGKQVITACLGLLIFLSVTANAATCSFNDVSPTSPFLPYICKLVSHGIAVGCGNGNFCPNGSVIGSQMAVFLERAIHGSSYVPPSCTGGVYVDVYCPNVFSNWIEQCTREGICYGYNTGPTYCTSGAIYREKIAVEVLRGKHGGTWVPPGPTPYASCRTSRIFTDVGCAWWFMPWIEDLYNEGISGGCANNPKRFCPLTGLNRAQMAVYIVTAFGLT